MRGKLIILACLVLTTCAQKPAYVSPLAYDQYTGAQLEEELSPGISAGETCAGKPAGSACWQAPANRPDCYLWNPDLNLNSTVTWSGACSGGLAQGDGGIKWAWGADYENAVTYTGTLRQGRMDGQWSSRDADNTVGEGQLVNGIPHGQWLYRYADGTELEGAYVDGKENGQWILRQAGGAGGEGPIVEGNPAGRWVLRTSSGAILEGDFVSGKQEGIWTEYDPSSGVKLEGQYINGKKHGQWTAYWKNDEPLTLTYQNGELDLVLTLQSLLTVENLNLIFQLLK